MPPRNVDRSGVAGTAGRSAVANLEAVGRRIASVVFDRRGTRSGIRGYADGGSEPHVLAGRRVATQALDLVTREGEGQLHGRQRFERVVGRCAVDNRVVAGARVPMPIDLQALPSAHSRGLRTVASTWWLVVKVRSNTGSARPALPNAAEFDAVAPDEQRHQNEQAANAPHEWIVTQ